MASHTEIVTLIDVGTGLLYNLNLQDYDGPEIMIPGAVLNITDTVLPPGRYRIVGKPETTISDGNVIHIRYLVEKV